MKGFEPATLKWGGESFVVPADQQLMLIAQIEDALAGASGQQAINVLVRPGGPSYSRLAQAFGAALRYAGADVTDDEIYLSIMTDFADGGADVAVKVQNAVIALLQIIAPPLAMHIGGDANPPKPGEDPAAS